MKKKIINQLQYSLWLRVKLNQTRRRPESIRKLRRLLLKLKAAMLKSSRQPVRMLLRLREQDRPPSKPRMKLRSLENKPGKLSKKLRLLLPTLRRKDLSPKPS